MDSLRALPSPKHQSFNYKGHVIEEDMENMMHRLTHTTMQLSSDRDYRGIIPSSAVRDWEQELFHAGFVNSDTNKTHATYTKGDASITRSVDGLVHYHKEISQEVVHMQVSQREGRRLPPLPSVAEFTNQIDDLSNESSVKDREGQQL